MGLLIVGGGLAAQRCIEVLRAAGDDRPVTVVSDEPVRPYDRPPLSKEGLRGTIDPAFRPAGWYAGRARPARHPRHHHHPEGRMSLIARIEGDLCLAHGDCEAVAPEAFRVDDVARVVGETADDRLREAARACPAGAIVLFDADTGEEVED
jgi:ferredoxin